jgi:hypothetical protein
MKTIVRYEFDRTDFFIKPEIPRFIKLIDPPVIPSTGDAVHLRLEEFIDDADFLRFFEDQTEGITFYAERSLTIVGKNEIEVIIVLHDEVNFKIFFPQFFSES